MGNLEKPELIFWFDAPPRAGAGVFRHVASEWGKPVFFLCAGPLREERKAGGWQECDYDKAIVIILSEQANPDLFLRKFLLEHNTAIHICNGLRSNTSPYIKKYLFRLTNPNIAIWSERPGVYGNKMKQITRYFMLPIVHRYYALLFGKKVKAFLPLGTLGIKTFVKYGWDEKIMFPFLYDPIKYPDIEVARKNKNNNHCVKINMLYIGRFSKSTKGLDILIDAVNKLTGEYWHLDLVGGYGEMRDVALAWAEKQAKVDFIGKWPSSEVSQRMTAYDFCIVPSRFDGWNVVTNEALRAGIGVIASDAAVSDDLIRASGAGTVVPAGSVDALREAIQRVIDNPAIAEAWKERARAYSPRISSETVGRYLMDILEYAFIDPTRPRPECPWL